MTDPSMDLTGSELNGLISFFITYKHRAPRQNHPGSLSLDRSAIP